MSNPAALTEPLGQITFECETNGTIEVMVIKETSLNEPDKVHIHTDMKLTNCSMNTTDKGLQIAPSVIFSLFEIMMEAQRAKGN